jgi:hypothetical protein
VLIVEENRAFVLYDFVTDTPVVLGGLIHEYFPVAA